MRNTDTKLILVKTSLIATVKTEAKQESVHEEKSREVKRGEKLYRHANRKKGLEKEK